MWTVSRRGLGSLECRHWHSSIYFLTVEGNLTLLPSITVPAWWTVPPHCEPKSNLPSLSCFHQLQKRDTWLTPVLIGEHGKFWRTNYECHFQVRKMNPWRTGAQLVKDPSEGVVHLSIYIPENKVLFSADWLVPGVERRMWCVELWVPLFRKLRKYLWRVEITHNQGFCGGSCKGGIRSPGLPPAICSPKPTASEAFRGRGKHFLQAEDSVP